MNAAVNKTLREFPDNSSSIKNVRYAEIPEPAKLPGHSRGLHVDCYHDQIPDFVESEIKRRYGSIFSSVEKLRLSGDISDISTYVAMKDGDISAILLFRHVGSCLQVVNQVMTLSEEDIQCFASYVFDTFDGTNAISFNAVHTDLQRISFPFQQFNYSENIVVALPPDIKTYWSSLGKSTRHNINYYRNKLNRDFSPFTFTVYEKEAINDHQIRAVLELSRQRIEGKGKSFGFNEQEQEHLIRLAKTDGLVGLIEIDGKIRAGSICFRSADNFCLEVISHDPTLNEYRLGTLCCYLTISECIARGAQEYHFLWGEYDYKYRFLGQQRRLDNIAIYRSRWSMLCECKLCLRMQLQGAFHSARRWKNSRARQRR